MALTDKFEDLGPNSGLVEEMYRQFLENPGSVSASWRPNSLTNRAPDTLNRSVI